MRTAKTLIRSGRSESSLGAHYWFCHVAAQLVLMVLVFVLVALYVFTFLYWSSWCQGRVAIFVALPGALSLLKSLMKLRIEQATLFSIKPIHNSVMVARLFLTSNK